LAGLSLTLCEPGAGARIGFVSGDGVEEKCQN